VLSEIPEEWLERLGRFMAQTAASSPGASPSAGDVAMLFQTIVGAWPPELAIDDRAGCAAYCERLAAWQQKALREAKLATDWTAPNEAYESAARKLLKQLFADPSGLLGEVAAFAHRIAPAGAVNGLTQVVLKLTAPGIPDFYQGTEFWDLSLVDPDNRREVDFKARIDALASLTSFRDLARRWRNGRIKQAVIRHILAFREKCPDLFGAGEYIPLAIDGPAADHVMAFARRRGSATAIMVAARLTAHLLGPGDAITIPPSAWADTAIRLPRGMAPHLRNVLTGEECFAEGGCGPVSLILAELPVALLATAADEIAKS
jgi:(1->4)-alpha-D-glucan 1-alpha-D-glucosylmutase